MAGPDGEKCRTCHYFSHFGHEDAIEDLSPKEVKGYCRAEPPRIIGDSAFDGTWPVASGIDWCGRWRQRVEVDPTSWWGSYECLTCEPPTCFDVRFDEREPHDEVSCPVCGEPCKLRASWNATPSGHGARSERDAGVRR